MLTRFHLKYTTATSIHQIFHVCQVLDGALVGGPDHNDNYVDDRSNFQVISSTWWSYILVFPTYMVLQSLYHWQITSHMTSKQCNHNTYQFFLSLPLANQTNEVATDYNAGFQSALAGLNKIYGWPVTISFLLSTGWANVVVNLLH